MIGPELGSTAGRRGPLGPSPLSRYGGSGGSLLTTLSFLCAAVNFSTPTLQLTLFSPSSRSLPTLYTESYTIWSSSRLEYQENTLAANCGGAKKCAVDKQRPDGEVYVQDSNERIGDDRV